MQASVTDPTPKRNKESATEPTREPEFDVSVLGGQAQKDARVGGAVVEPGATVLDVHLLDHLSIDKSNAMQYKTSEWCFPVRTIERPGSKSTKKARVLRNKPCMSSFATRLESAAHGRRVREHDEGRGGVVAQLALEPLELLRVDEDLMVAGEGQAGTPISTCMQASVEDWRFRGTSWRLRGRRLYVSSASGHSSSLTNQQSRTCCRWSGSARWTGLARVLGPGRRTSSAAG